MPTSQGSYAGSAPGDPAATNPGAVQYQAAPDALVGNVVQQSLINGTPSLLSAPTPNDGVTHLYQVSIAVNVIVSEVGGRIDLQYTVGGVGQTITGICAGGGAAGSTQQGVATVACDPGSTITVKQGTNMTSGTAKLSATIELVA